MHTLLLRLAPASELPPRADLLRDWLLRSELGDAVVEFEEDPEQDRAEVVISRGDRRVQLRLAHAEGELWRLDAVTWLVYAGSRSPWTAGVGLVVLCGGLALSFGYLAWSPFTFWLGVLVSAVMGAWLTWEVRRQVRRGRIGPVEAGPHAESLIERVLPAIRGDRRVKEVQPVSP